jgi:hypothetical protein
MFSIVCKQCVQNLTLPAGQIPPWCPRCGANLQGDVAVPGSPAPSPPAKPFDASRWCLPPTPRADGSLADHVTALNGTPRRGTAIAARPEAAPPVTSPEGEEQMLTAYARCRMRYTCAACGCIHEREHKVEGKGWREQTARERANENLAAQIHSLPGSPCPTCGLLRADRMLMFRIWGHALTLIDTAALLLVLCCVSLFMSDGAPDHLTLVAAGVVVIAALVHLFLATFGSGSDRDGNRAQAARDKEAGLVEVHKEGSMEQFHDPGTLSSELKMALAALAVTPAFFLLPWLVRQSQNWPINPDMSPSLVSPGDQVKVVIRDHKLRSVGAFWSAAATARVLNGRELQGPLAYTATSRPMLWGARILVDRHAAADYTSPLGDLYAWVSIPDIAALGGKTVRLRVDLTVDYPLAKGKPTTTRRGQFVGQIHVQTSTVSRELEIRLAPAGASQTHATASTIGSVLGLLTHALGGLALLGLAWIRRSEARAPELVPLLA